MRRQRPIHTISKQAFLGPNESIFARFDGLKLLGAEMMKEMKGVCFLFSETGTEGGWWAMQEDGFVTEDGHWKYGGLQCLTEGDDFTVYADDGRVLFHAIIHQDTTTAAVPRQVLHNGRLLNHRTWKQQVVGSMWVHWVQENMDRDVWGELFTGNKRCLLKRAERIEQTN